MKKGFALALALVLLLSLPACGGKDPPAGSDNRLLEDLQSAIGGNSGEGTGGAQAQTFENQIALSIDKTNYDKKERIEVTMDFGDVDKDNAVIVIVNSDMAHGELTPAEGKCEEYRWLSDFSEIPFYLSAPDQDGLFDVRVYATGNGEELASVSFVVGSAVQGKPESKPTETEGSRWFTDEVLAEMKLTGFTQPEGFEVLTDEELPDHMEDDPYCRVLKGASDGEEYYPVVEKAWNLLNANYGEVYTWVLRQKDHKYIWKSMLTYGGDPFYVWDGDTIRSVEFSFGFFDGVEGEQLEITLNPDADDPRNDYDWQ